MEYSVPEGETTVKICYDVDLLNVKVLVDQPSGGVDVDVHTVTPVVRAGSEVKLRHLYDQFIILQIYVKVVAQGDYLFETRAPSNSTNTS